MLLLIGANVTTRCVLVVFMMVACPLVGLCKGQTIGSDPVDNEKVWEDKGRLG